MEEKRYRDWDGVEDVHGNHYRVVGAWHPQNGIHVQSLPFSSHLSSETTPFPPSPLFQSVNRFSSPVLEMPHSAIRNHVSPLQKFQEILLVVENGFFAQRQQLSLVEREAVEAGLSIAHQFHIEIQAVGVTGLLGICDSDPLHDHQILQNHQLHQSTSEIHLIIYGFANTQKIVSVPLRLSSEREGLRSPMKIEILPNAERIALATGQSMEDCFQMLYYRYDQFFLRNRQIRLSFVPTFAEMANDAPYHEVSHSSFTLPTISVKITATITKGAWGCYYPYFYEISDVKIHGIKNTSKNQPIPPVSSITRVLILECELWGYYRKGERIEAMGTLQPIQTIPDSSLPSSQGTYQMVLGSPDSYEGEYIVSQTRGSR